jgi:alkylation response protein AidB-like acyl-CoA dehydrogenase
MVDTLEKIRELRPTISALAPQIEQERRLPSSLLDALKAAGVFRMYVPKSHGGDERPPAYAVKVLEEISRGDASSGWLCTIGAATPALISRLPAAAYNAIYADGPDVIQAGALVPRGRAVRVEGGFLFTGQWPFASGCLHADYLNFASAVDGGGPGGRREVRFGLARPDKLEILDTWRVSGLKGTGSHDIRASELFVPTEWTGVLGSAASVARHPMDAASPVARLGLELAAVALGNAQGAVDELVQVGLTKRPMAGLLNPLAKDPTFHQRLGQIDRKVRAARALLYDMASADWDRVQRGETLGERETHERLSMLSFIGELATSAVDGCFREAGTTGLFEDSPLQRRLRDGHAVVQHFFLSRGPAPVGAMLLGEPGPPPII